MISNNQLILVTGAPASGKTRIGKQLATALAIPFFDKDNILESLFETLGIGDHQWRTRLSRASDEIFLNTLVQIPSAVAVSYWRHPKYPSKDSGTPTTQLIDSKAFLIEVYCACDAAVAAKRFEARTRHAGHLDGVPADHRQQHRHGIRQYAELGPLGLGHLIEVDTNNENEQQLFKITAEIRKLWADLALRNLPHQR